MSGRSNKQFISFSKASWGVGGGERRTRRRLTESEILGFVRGPSDLQNQTDLQADTHLF
ncbi:MAG: hypothetical protein ACKERG_00080 [Candidatus Hodgkinia cicadicola]